MTWLGVAFRVVLGILSLGAIALSLTTNAAYWTDALKSDPTAQQIAVAVSILAGLFKIAVPAAVRIMKPATAERRGLWALFALALLFDVTSGLGYAGMVRGSASGEQRQTNNQRRGLEADRKRVEAELARLEVPRAFTSIEAERRVAEAQKGDCGPRSGRSHLDSCTRPGKLDGELGNAAAYGAAVDKLARIDAALTALPPAKDADPQAAAIVRALKFVKLDIEEATAGILWGLVLLMLLELGSTVGPAATLAPRSEGPSRPAGSPLDHVGVTGAATSAAPLAAPPRPAKGRQRLDLAVTLRSIQSRTLAVPGAVVAADGSMTLSQSELAAVLGTSKTIINRGIKDLRDAGTVTVKAGRGGTHIKFATPPVSALN